ncbi:MAG: hypothetical protein CR982_09210 [Candidatus Cloacimonadota bacterium]|nr:MAG: hypothetical protein CR982_09210 [Candidatus Cloacimonadota bacterium]PIE77487.1 MAG: hypothetical protein CSA15_12500 [Candidatus Delongbacteria bacterium]
MEEFLIEDIDVGIKPLLGFALKSRNLVLGFNKLFFQREKDVGIIMVSTSLQLGSLKKIKKKFTNTDSVLYLYNGELGSLVNRPEIMVLGVKKSNFISGIKKYIKINGEV